MIGSVLTVDGEVKGDTLDIANVFTHFYKNLCSDAGKFLHEIATLGPHADHNIDPVTEYVAAEQIKKMRRGK